ncbi:hypothetical protein ACFWBN_10475 [Streptomyces sp. NPDC059989]|uniref:hypothetical protein n=1 Tax=Streptomyces sp. NPDC059989 TaxID=3347026 RepID=UPI003679F1A2
MVPHVMEDVDGGDAFIATSAALTGFSEEELRATGMSEEYRAVVREQVGADRYKLLVEEEQLPDRADGDRRSDEGRAELADAVIRLWYTGSWPGLDGTAPFTVSARAYAAGLVWRAFGGEPPGVGPSGFGSWAEAPVDVAAGAGVAR